MNKKAIIFIILIIGLIIRFIRIDQPLSEFSTRQVETAMIARNFYHHGFKLFFPEMDFAGEKGASVIVALEFGLMPFLAAILYKIFNGVHEYLGRIVSIAFWLGGAIIFYRWILLFGKRLALFALIVCTFLPLSIILSRTFQPEMAMLFFSILGLYYLTRYSLGEPETNLWIGAGAVAMAVLLKITALGLILPFTFLVLKRERLTSNRSHGMKFWIAGLLIISPSLAWYSWGLLLSQIYPSKLGSGCWEVSNRLNLFLMCVRPESWRSIFSNLWGAVLTPLGFSLFLLGLFLKKDRSREYLFLYWLIGIAISLLLFFYHAQTHIYYWLPLVPVGAYFMAKSLVILGESRIGDSIYKNILLKTALILIICIMIFYYIYPAYRVPRTYRHVGKIAEVVKTLTPPESLVIASCSSGPYFLYYCRRRGWDFWVNNPGIDAISRLEYLREQGGEYFASANIEEVNKNKIFSEYLYNTYNVIWEKEKTGVIFLLK